MMMLLVMVIKIMTMIFIMIMIIIINITINAGDNRSLSTIFDQKKKNQQKETTMLSFVTFFLKFFSFIFVAQT